MSSSSPYSYANGKPLYIATDTCKRTSGVYIESRGASTPTFDGADASGNKRTKVTGGEQYYYGEDVVTPVKTMISSNVTPRSGSRKARAETASPSPGSTPKGKQGRHKRLSTPSDLSHAQADDTYERTLPMRGTTVSPSLLNGGLTESSRVEAPFTFRPPLQERDSGISNASSESATFFYASEITAPALTSRPSSRPTSSAGHRRVLDSQGARIAPELLPTNKTPSMNVIGTTLNEEKPRFFYANHAREALSPSVSNSNMNATSTAQRPVLHKAYTEYPSPTSHSVRPPSPLKEEVLPRGSSGPIATPKPQRRLTSSGRADFARQADRLEREDVAYRAAGIVTPLQQVGKHQKAASVSSFEPTNPRSPMGARGEVEPRHNNKSIYRLSYESAHSRNDGATTRSPDTPGSPYRIPPHSPIKTPSKVDQLNEMAAQARRERKVLDLEISNSSLLAINRTLEREMRKQTAELRKLRRMTMATVSKSERSVANRSTLSDAYASTDSSSSDEDHEDDDDPDDDNDDLTDLSSPPSTRSRPCLRDVKQKTGSRFQDPKVVPLDLAAQRNLLLDTQKLNQQIKRCIGQSDGLLSSGRLALEYRHQHVEADNLGPRVLNPDEIGDDATQSGQALLSPSHLRATRVSNPWERSLASIVVPDHLNMEYAPVSLLPGHEEDPYSILESTKIGDDTGEEADNQYNRANIARAYYNNSDGELASSPTTWQAGFKTNDDDNDDDGTSTMQQLTFGRLERTDHDFEVSYKSTTSPRMPDDEDCAMEPNANSTSTEITKLETVGVDEDEATMSAHPEIAPEVPSPEAADIDETSTTASEPNTVSGAVPDSSTLPNTAGNRSSFQQIGSYLSSFGKFAGGLRPA